MWGNEERNRRRDGGRFTEKERRWNRSCFDKAYRGRWFLWAPEESPREQRGDQNEPNEMSIAEIAVSPSSRAGRSSVIEYRETARRSRPSLRLLTLTILLPRGWFTAPSPFFPPSLSTESQSCVVFSTALPRSRGRGISVRKVFNRKLNKNRIFCYLMVALICDAMGKDLPCLVAGWE